MLHEGRTVFFGFVRYENRFEAKRADGMCWGSAMRMRGVEVFVNGTSLRNQIVPTYRYDHEFCRETVK